MACLIPCVTLFYIISSFHGFVSLFLSLISISGSHLQSVNRQQQRYGGVVFLTCKTMLAIILTKLSDFQTCSVLSSHPTQQQMTKIPLFSAFAPLSICNTNDAYSIKASTMQPATHALSVILAGSPPPCIHTPNQPLPSTQPNHPLLSTPPPAIKAPLPRPTHPSTQRAPSKPRPLQRPHDAKR